MEQYLISIIQNFLKEMRMNAMMKKSRLEDIMKKLLAISIFLLTILTFHVQTTSANRIVYPFDSITIKSAYTFKVQVTQEPSVHSFLHEQVEVGEVLTIYCGQLEFLSNGITGFGSQSILVITNEAGIDLVRWLDNGYHYDQNMGETYEYSSHIKINPHVGVEKTLDEEAFKAELFIPLSEPLYRLIDNAKQEYIMIPHTLVIEDEVNLIISTNEGDTHEETN
jgi:hypothetical protein